MRLQESHVETDDSGPIARQHVHQCREFGPGPGPTPFCRQAFFVDHRQYDCWEGSHLTTREQTEVVGFQFDQVEDGGTGYVEHDHDEDGAECQGSRTDGEQRWHTNSHQLRLLVRWSTDWCTRVRSTRLLSCTGIV